MWNSRWVCLIVGVWTSVACSDSGGDDDATGGTSNQAGTGGSVGGTSGSGGSAAGVGGSVAGSSAQGGTGGGVTGGTGGAAGRGGSSSGSAGMTTIPLPSGSIGTGSVPCSTENGDSCGSGKACCHDILGSECVTSYASCECGVKGTCTNVGCDDAADCPGAKCCALRNPRSTPAFVGTSCKAACDSNEAEVCSSDADCNGGLCTLSSVGFSTCF